MKPTFKIKRIYEAASRQDGFRVLVDRVWPRGVTKEEADIDEWAKEIAPTTELRKWFGHSSELWNEFQKKYKAELKKNEAIADFIETCKDKRRITLLYGAKDEEHNHAIVLKDFLEKEFN